jgi:hypothetical protein
VVPPPVREPFDIPFPADLHHRAPGLWAVLTRYGATLAECGMTQADGAGVLTQNQCLYLSLAAAVGPSRAELHDLAGSLRAQIEGAVRQARPRWAERDHLGQEVGAFADFLTWGLQAAPLLRDRAVAVYDARTASCEIFRPPLRDPRHTPVAALWFSGAHYRWVRWREPGPTLAQLLEAHAHPPLGTPRVITVTNIASG